MTQSVVTSINLVLHRGFAKQLVSANSANLQMGKPRLPYVHSMPVFQKQAEVHSTLDFFNESFGIF